MDSQQLSDIEKKKGLLLTEEETRQKDEKSIASFADQSMEVRKKSLQQSTMDAYLGEKLGEKYDDAAPLTKAEQAEVDHASIFKRSSKKEELKKLRSRSYETRAKSMWQIRTFDDNIQKEEEEKKEQGFQINEYGMEKMPILGTLKERLTSISCLSPEQQVHLTELMNNSKFWLTSMMNDEPVAATYVDMRKVIYTDLDNVTQDMASMIQILGSLPEIADEDIAAVQEAVNMLSGTMEKMQCVRKKVQDGNQNGYPGVTWREYLRMKGLGAAVRTEQQQDQFRKREDQIAPVNYEAERRQITEEEAREENMSSLDRKLSQAKRFMKMSQKIDCRMSAAQDDLSDYVKIKMKNHDRIDAQWLFDFRTDSEGKHLLSEEARFEKAKKLAQQRYAGNAEERAAAFDEMMARSKQSFERMVQCQDPIKNFCELDPETLKIDIYYNLCLQNEIQVNQDCIEKLPLDKKYELALMYNQNMFFAKWYHSRKFTCTSAFTGLESDEISEKMLEDKFEMHYVEKYQALREKAIRMWKNRSACSPEEMSKYLRLHMNNTDNVELKTEQAREYLTSQGEKTLGSSNDTDEAAMNRYKGIWRLREFRRDIADEKKQGNLTNDLCLENMAELKTLQSLSEDSTLSDQMKEQLIIKLNTCRICMADLLSGERMGAEDFRQLEAQQVQNINQLRTEMQGIVTLLGDKASEKLVTYVRETERKLENVKDKLQKTVQDKKADTSWRKVMRECGLGEAVRTSAEQTRFEKDEQGAGKA